MIEVHLLTEHIVNSDKAVADLISQPYEPITEYTKSWINPKKIEMIISLPKKDTYIIQFSSSDGEVTAKINPDEFERIYKK